MIKTQHILYLLKENQIYRFLILLLYLFCVYRFVYLIPEYESVFKIISINYSGGGQQLIGTNLFWIVFLVFSYLFPFNFFSKLLLSSIPNSTVRTKQKKRSFIVYTGSVLSYATLFLLLNLEIFSFLISQKESTLFFLNNQFFITALVIISFINILTIFCILDFEFLGYVFVFLIELLLLLIPEHLMDFGNYYLMGSLIIFNFLLFFSIFYLYLNKEIY